MGVGNTYINDESWDPNPACDSSTPDKQQIQHKWRGYWDAPRSTSTDYTLVIVVMVENDAFNHLFLESGFHGNKDRTMGGGNSSFGTLIVPQIGSKSDCLSKAHLLMPEDNTKHLALAEIMDFICVGDSDTPAMVSIR
uniref:Uncharacterized protein n=1 Tax=Romanomermis culicivorax TaxID=13658 RepID=A0A915IWA1_ROMCU